MRTRVSTALSTALLFSLAIGGGEVSAKVIPQPDGTPQVAGRWVGKMKGTEFNMGPDSHGGRIRVPVTLDLAQEGALLEAALTTLEEDSRNFLLAGIVGSGHIWLTGDSTGLDTPIVLSCHVKGKPGRYKMKATGIATFSSSVAELKISLKQSPPMMVLSER